MVAPLAPGNILFGRTRRALLALTFLRPDESFYLREIVRRTGCGTGAVQRELKLLTEAGILRRDRQRFFQANAQSPLFEPLMQIVVRTVGLGERLRSALSPVGGQVAVALIFGSFARSKHHENSDVDLLIISEDDQLSVERIMALVRNAQAEIGREINPFVIAAGEWRSKLRAGNGFVSRVVGGEKLFLIGDVNELERVGKERLAQDAQGHATGGDRSDRTGRSGPSKRKGKRAR